MKTALASLLPPNRLRDGPPRERRSPTATVFLLLSVCLSDGRAAEDDYRTGRAAYDAGRFEDAATIWIPLAMSGDLRAQFAVATLYGDGVGVAQDYEQSIYWFARAAEQGLPAAQFNLGNAYRHGRGVPQDDEQAVRWWTQAADQGFAPAQFNLGTQYLHGRGVVKDETEALAWYRRAAAGGHARARQIVAEVDAAVVPAPASAVPEPEPEPAPASPAPAAATFGIELHGAEWLLARAPEHYTLQLAAMSERERIPRFIQQHRLVGPLAVFSFRRDARRYFALLYGDYPDRASARRAAAELPLALRAGSPWARPMAEIQNLIRANPAE